jgi:hypothetical protein
MPEYPRSDKERIAALEKDNENIHINMGSFVTRDEFTSVKLIAYGFVAIVLSSVLISIMGRFVFK